MGEIAPRPDGGARYQVDRTEDGVTLLTLSGELDLATVEQMKPAIEPTMAAVQRGLVVDITAVRFADSSAIAMWVGWSRRVPDIEIRNASPLIRRVIEAMGLDSVLRVV